MEEAQIVSPAEAESAPAETVPADAEAAGRREAFESLIRGEYKAEFDERVQRIIDRRFRDLKRLEAQAERAKPLFQLLEKRYGGENAEPRERAAADLARRWQLDARMAKEIYPGFDLPKMLARALKIQAGLMKPDNQPTDLKAFHVNQRNEGIDLNGVSGALMATTNMQMQTFVTQPDEAVEGFDGYNGDLTGDVAATLGVNCGMSTGRNGVMAFAANQRDEVRDLHDVAGALGAQPGMKQQTFVASGVVTKGNGDCFLSEERHTALSAGGGQAGQGYPCVLTAAFSAGAGVSAEGIGYGEELSPTLKGSAGGNCMPSVLCLNDQGGNVMECSENVSGTLRAQEHGHQPLVYENHGIDSRYTGPHKVAPTMSARYGTGFSEPRAHDTDSHD